MKVQVGQKEYHSDDSVIYPYYRINIICNRVPIYPPGSSLAPFMIASPGPLVLAMSPPLSGGDSGWLILLGGSVWWVRVNFSVVVFTSFGLGCRVVVMIIFERNPRRGQVQSASAYLVATVMKPPYNSSPRPK